MSRTPAIDICSVRGIGVALIEITSTRSFSWRSSSFCLTPKRCSSSTISSPRSLRAHVPRQQPMGPDQDVDLALGEPRHRLALLGSGAKPRHVLDRDRVVLEPLGERPEVLLGEDRGRHQQHHLLAVLHGLERRPQRDLGLAVADVAADQPVHRPRRLHVGLDELDRVALVGGLGERERVLELALPVGIGRERVALAALALRVQVEQLAGELLGRAPGPGLDRVPAVAAELGQRRMRAAGADEAADLGQLVDGHEHPVRAGVLEVQVVARDPCDRLGVEARRTAPPRGPRGRRCRRCAGR